MAIFIRPLIIAVTDPGEGSRDPAPPLFSDHIDARPRPPFSQGLDDHRPLPPPPPISSSGSGTVLTTPENTITYHNTLY